MKPNISICGLVDQKFSAILPLLNRPFSTYSDLSSSCLQENDQDVRMIWQIAARNKILPALVESYLQRGNGTHIPEKYAGLHEKQSKIINRYLAELENIGNIFIKNDLPVIVLENGGLAYAIYRNPGCYSFGDFDLLLDLRHLWRAHEKLREIGYDVLTKACSENSTGFDFISGRIEYVKRLDDDLTLRLNVQSTLVARKWFFLKAEPDFNTLLNRSLVIPGHAVRVLGREDFLYQLCVHNASHGFIRKPGIRLHLDIDWYIRSVHKEIDWSAFIAVVQQMHVTTMAYFSLLIPKVILETPVPENVMVAIRPRHWKQRLIMKTLANGNLLEPEKRQFSKAAFLVFNILIHDSLKDFFRAVLPSRKCLIERYGLKNNQSRVNFLYQHYKNATCGKR